MKKIRKTKKKVASNKKVEEEFQVNMVGGVDNIDQVVVDMKKKLNDPKMKEFNKKGYLLFNNTIYDMLDSPIFDNNETNLLSGLTDFFSYYSSILPIRSVYTETQKRLIQIIRYYYVRACQPPHFESSELLKIFEFLSEELNGTGWTAENIKQNKIFNHTGSEMDNHNIQDNKKMFTNTIHQTTNICNLDIFQDILYDINQEKSKNVIGNIDHNIKYPFFELKYGGSGMYKIMYTNIYGVFDQIWYSKRDSPTNNGGSIQDIDTKKNVVGGGPGSTHKLVKSMNPKYRDIMELVDILKPFLPSASDHFRDNKDSFYINAIIDIFLMQYKISQNSWSLEFIIALFRRRLPYYEKENIQTKLDWLNILYIGGDILSLHSDISGYIDYLKNAFDEDSFKPIQTEIDKLDDKTDLKSFIIIHKSMIQMIREMIEKNIRDWLNESHKDFTDEFGATYKDLGIDTSISFFNIENPVEEFRAELLESIDALFLYSNKTIYEHLKRLEKIDKIKKEFKYQNLSLTDRILKDNLDEIKLSKQPIYRVMKHKIVLDQVTALDNKLHEFKNILKINNTLEFYKEQFLLNKTYLTNDGCFKKILAENAENIFKTIFNNVPFWMDKTILNKVCNEFLYEVIKFEKPDVIDWMTSIQIKITNIGRQPTGLSEEADVILKKIIILNSSIYTDPQMYIDFIESIKTDILKNCNDQITEDYKKTKTYFEAQIETIDRNFLIDILFGKKRLLPTTLPLLTNIEFNNFDENAYDAIMESAYITEYKVLLTNRPANEKINYFYTFIHKSLIKYLDDKIDKTPPTEPIKKSVFSFSTSGEEQAYITEVHTKTKNYIKALSYDDIQNMITIHNQLQFNKLSFLHLFYIKDKLIEQNPNRENFLRRNMFGMKHQINEVLKDSFTKTFDSTIQKLLKKFNGKELVSILGSIGQITLLGMSVSELMNSFSYIYNFKYYWYFLRRIVQPFTNQNNEDVYNKDNLKLIDNAFKLPIKISKGHYSPSEATNYKYFFNKNEYFVIKINDLPIFFVKVTVDKNRKFIYKKYTITEIIEFFVKNINEYQYSANSIKEEIELYFNDKNYKNKDETDQANKKELYFIKDSTIYKKGEDGVLDVEIQKIKTPPIAIKTVWELFNNLIATPNQEVQRNDFPSMYTLMLLTDNLISKDSKNTAYVFYKDKIHYLTKFNITKTGQDISITFILQPVNIRYNKITYASDSDKPVDEEVNISVTNEEVKILVTNTLEWRKELEIFVNMFILPKEIIENIRIEKGFHYKDFTEGDIVKTNGLYYKFNTVSGLVIFNYINKTQNLSDSLKWALLITNPFENSHIQRLHTAYLSPGDSWIKTWLKLNDDNSYYYWLDSFIKSDKYKSTHTNTIETVDTNTTETVDTNTIETEFKAIYNPSIVANGHYDFITNDLIYKYNNISKIILPENATKVDDIKVTKVTIKFLDYAYSSKLERFSKKKEREERRSKIINSVAGTIGRAAGTTLGAAVKLGEGVITLIGVALAGAGGIVPGVLYTAIYILTILSTSNAV